MIKKKTVRRKMEKPRRRLLQNRREARRDMETWSASFSLLMKQKQSPLSSGELSSTVTALNQISYPVRSISSVDAANMIVMLCEAVLPTNEVVSAQLCQFIYILSIKQQVLHRALIRACLTGFL